MTTDNDQAAAAALRRAHAVVLHHRDGDPDSIAAVMRDCRDDVDAVNLVAALAAMVDVSLTVLAGDAAENILRRGTLAFAADEVGT